MDTDPTLPQKDYSDYNMQLKAGEASPEFSSRRGYSNDEVAWNLPLGGAFPLPETLEMMTPLVSGTKLLKQHKDKENLTELDATQIENRFLIQKFFFTLFLSLFSAYLAYSCNYVDDKWFSGSWALRWLYTLVAFIFGGMYLLFHVVVHVIGDSVLVSEGLPSSCLPQAIAQVGRIPST